MYTRTVCGAVHGAVYVAVYVAVYGVALGAVHRLYKKPYPCTVSVRFKYVSCNGSYTEPFSRGRSAPLKILPTENPSH